MSDEELRRLERDAAEDPEAARLLRVARRRLAADPVSPVTRLDIVVNFLLDRTNRGAAESRTLDADQVAALARDVLAKKHDVPPRGILHGAAELGFDQLGHAPKARVATFAAAVVDRGDLILGIAKAGPLDLVLTPWHELHDAVTDPARDPFSLVASPTDEDIDHRAATWRDWASKATWLDDYEPNSGSIVVYDAFDKKRRIQPEFRWSIFVGERSYVAEHDGSNCIVKQVKNLQPGPYLGKVVPLERVPDKILEVLKETISPTRVRAPCDVAREWAETRVGRSST